MLPAVRALATVWKWVLFFGSFCAETTFVFGACALQCSNTEATTNNNTVVKNLFIVFVYIYKNTIVYSLPFTAHANQKTPQKLIFVCYTFCNTANKKHSVLWQSYIFLFLQPKHRVEYCQSFTIVPPHRYFHLIIYIGA